MRYHCCIDLDYILRRGGAAEMAGRVKLAGRNTWATEPAVLTHAACLKAMGYEVMPTCAHHNDRGYCLGHPSDDDGKPEPAPSPSPFTSSTV